MERKQLSDAEVCEPVAWLNTATGNVTTSSAVVMDWDDEKEHVQSLYTHGDAGELERLREGISKHWKIVCDQRAELDTLRAQLAELPEKLIRAIDKEQERLTAEDYLMDSDDCIKVIRETLTAGTDPNAPVERDERALFEAHYVEWFNRKYSPTEPLTIESMVASRRGDNYGSGSLGKNGKWEGWQARAALERKP